MEENTKKLESCSFASDDYSIRGDLFLVNDWEKIRPTPNCGVLTLWVKPNECSTVRDNV
jgi:hypothetical protein